VGIEWDRVGSSGDRGTSRVRWASRSLRALRASRVETLYLERLASHIEGSCS